MTISTTPPQSRLSIVSAFLETKRGGILDSVAVLERTPLGNVVRAQEIGKGIEERAVSQFRQQFPTAICECKVS